MGDLVEKAAIPTRELEVVPKSHDDAYLRPPDLSLGERPCCLGERCICVWMARWRYGDDTDLAFVGTEFLLPSQRAAFERDGGSALPPTPGKCLVCSRYMHVRRRLSPTLRVLGLRAGAEGLQSLWAALGLRAGELPAHLTGARVARGGKSSLWQPSTAQRGVGSGHGRSCTPGRNSCQECRDFPRAQPEHLFRIGGRPPILND